MSGIDVARQATVSVCSRAGVHHGQGLLLDLDEEGIVVLTCHHVIAPLQKDDLCIALLQAGGQLGPPIPVQYDQLRSRPNRDAVVLRLQGVSAPARPLLHAMNPNTYAGGLRAIGISYLSPRVFDAWVAACTSLSVKVKVPGQWPDPPSMYECPLIYRLTDLSDAREGIIGSVVICEGGVLGLVHYARASGTTHKREGYLVPLPIWADGWPKLTEVIEPLLDARLRATATIKRPGALGVGIGADFDIMIAGYRSDLYIERAVEHLATDILANGEGVVIIGKPKSGKTRLALQLLQQLSGTLVVIPHMDPPSSPFELSGLSGQNLALFFDDLHRTIRTLNPLRWRNVLTEASGARCLLICTSRDGEEWKIVRDHEIPLLDELGQAAFVYTSKVEKKGEDFSEAQGWELAQGLGLTLSLSEFRKRFDGTPGSLTLNLEAMRVRYERLRERHLGEVSLGRLLDSAKLLYAANQPRLRINLLRKVAECIRGAGRLSSEIWETLQRSTETEGFGLFDRTTGEFQTYRPYFEECVLYEPTTGEIEALLPILAEMKDYVGLNYLSEALLMKYDSPLAETAVRISIEGGDTSAYSVLGMVLASQPGHEAEAEQAYLKAIDVGENPATYNNLGLLLAKQPGREVEAEQAYRTAIRAGIKSASVNLGNLLAGQPGREGAAEQAYRDALDAGLGALASYNLGLLLERQPERAEEAKQWYRRYQIALETGYSNNYLRPAPFPDSQHTHRIETEWALHTAINAEEKGASYSSFDNQTFKDRTDVPVPNNRLLYTAYRKLLSEFGRHTLDTEDES